LKAKQALEPDSACIQKIALQVLVHLRHITVVGVALEVSAMAMI
jgi:hypothetical protein